MIFAIWIALEEYNANRQKTLVSFQAFSIQLRMWSMLHATFLAQGEHNGCNCYRKGAFKI